MAAFQDYAGPGQASPGGHYRVSFITGLVVGLTAGQAVFCWRWAPVGAGLFCRLRQVRVAASIGVAFGTAQTSDIAMSLARNWGTAPTAGGTITMPTTANNQMADQGVSTQMAGLGGFIPTSTFAGLATIANTGALTTGSPTVDANPIAQEVFNIIALGSSDRVILYDVAPGFDYPLTFGANEGFILSVPTAQGATGKVVYYVNLAFSVNNSAF